MISSDQNQESIQNLCLLTNCSELEAISALEATSGNPDFAYNLLIENRIDSLSTQPPNISAGHRSEITTSLDATIQNEPIIQSPYVSPTLQTRNSVESAQGTTTGEWFSWVTGGILSLASRTVSKISTFLFSDNRSFSNFFRNQIGQSVRFFDGPFSAACRTASNERKNVFIVVIHSITQSDTSLLKIFNSDLTANLLKENFILFGDYSNSITGKQLCSFLNTNPDSKAIQLFIISPVSNNLSPNIVSQSILDEDETSLNNFILNNIENNIHPRNSVNTFNTATSISNNSLRNESPMSSLNNMLSNNLATSNSQSVSSIPNALNQQTNSLVPSSTNNNIAINSNENNTTNIVNNTITETNPVTISSNNSNNNIRNTNLISETSRLIEEQNREYNEILQRDIENQIRKENEKKSLEEKKKLELEKTENEIKKRKQYAVEMIEINNNPENKIKVCIRFPDGKRIVNKFNPQSKVVDLYKFVFALPYIYESEHAYWKSSIPKFFELRTSLPPIQIFNEFEKQLYDFNITNDCLLMIRTLDEDEVTPEFNQL